MELNTDMTPIVAEASLKQQYFETIDRKLVTLFFSTAHESGWASDEINHPSKLKRLHLLQLDALHI